MREVDIIDTLKDYIISEVKKVAKNGDQNRLVAILKVLQLPDKQIKAERIVAINHFPDPIASKRFEIVFDDDSTIQFERITKHSTHKIVQPNKLLKGILVDKKQKYGRNGNEPIGSIR